MKLAGLKYMMRDIVVHLLLNKKEMFCGVAQSADGSGYCTRWESRWASCESNKSWWGDARLWTIFHEYGVTSAGTRW